MILRIFLIAFFVVSVAKADAPSALSLVWKRGYSLEEKVSLSSFPLEPGLVGALYEWKASSEAPLLVYDKSGRGHISKARQLFGDWGLGGQRLVFSGTIWSMTPWENAYQVLAALDVDNNSKVDTEELTPLGLWFDHNQDGVSQSGEVKPVVEAGVLSIFYRNPNCSEQSNSCSLAVGYERQVNGQVETLPSIEWNARQLR